MRDRIPFAQANPWWWAGQTILMLLLVTSIVVAAGQHPAQNEGTVYIPMTLGRVFFTMTPVGDGFEDVTDITHAGDERLFIAERSGVVKIVHPDGRLAVFLDLSSKVISNRGEYGIYNLDFHPGYNDPASPGYGLFFVSYTTGIDDGVTRAVDFVVARYRISADVDVADPASETVIMREPQSSDVHKGGGMDFDPRDHYLYVGVGDDRLLTVAQHTGTPKGKVVRLAVDNVPPALTGDGRSYVNVEIRAMGLRNPWRIDVDPLDDRIFVGEVGYLSWEEINLVPLDQPGLNFGWPCLEGPDLVPNLADDPECQNTQSFQRAIHEYAHQDGSGRCAVIGGHAHRPAYNQGDGRYIFADMCTREISSLSLAGESWERAPLGIHDSNLISTIGEDAYGFQYVGTVGAPAPIYRLFIP